jgi:hypothetical protein
MRYRLGPALGQAIKRHEQGIMRCDWCISFINVFDVRLFELGVSDWTRERTGSRGAVVSF